MSDLRQYDVWSRTQAYRRRVDRARVEIEHAASRGRLVVCTSWGKDSTALLDLAIDALGPVDAMHLSSEYELPGGAHVVAHFAGRCNVHTVPSRRALRETIEWLQEYGLGYERDTLLSAGKQRKADAGIEWSREHGYAVQVLGMRAEEAAGRRKCFRVRGLTYAAHGLVCSNPIGWWETRDVWARIVSRGLPYHALYDRETHGQTRETLRNSGWLTVPATESDHRAAWLRQHYPEQYRRLVAEFPRVGLLG